jgi:tight adherence protein B
LAWIVAAALLTGAAIVAAWPADAVIRRLRGQQAAREWVLPTVGLVRIRARVQAFADRRPRWAVSVSALVAFVSVWIVAGPVAGFVLAVYGALGARAAIRRSARSRTTSARARSLDDLTALAADLRVGLAGSALRKTEVVVPESGVAAREGGVASPPPDVRLAELTAAVWRLAERTGAPAADLVDRIEADARAADRARAGAAAQAAGAKATALLLAAMPVGGVALGYGIGVNPLQVLLHTPLGAACAGVAVALQCAGLLWADRLASGPAR